MTLQIITPKWLASPEGKLWKKKMRKRHDEIIVEAFNEIEIPLLNEVVIPMKQDRKGES